MSFDRARHLIRSNSNDGSLGCLLPNAGIPVTRYALPSTSESFVASTSMPLIMPVRTRRESLMAS